MEILLRQSSSNDNKHLLTLEISDWMQYRKKLHYHLIFFMVVELIIKKGKGCGTEFAIFLIVSMGSASSTRFDTSVGAHTEETILSNLRSCAFLLCWSHLIYHLTTLDT
jgi:hypothetical protein